MIANESLFIYYNDFGLLFYTAAKLGKKMQEKQEECEISPNNGRQKALFRRLR
jgi:hypothetical protein